MKQKPIYMIVACDDNLAIGHKNALPWCIPEDLIRFKKITTTVTDSSKQNMIVMGKNTWNSLPYRPLPKRVNMIISSVQPLVNSCEQQIRQCTSLESAIRNANKDESIESVFIIGGSSIYNYAMLHRLCDKIFMTKVDGKHDADAYINPINAEYYENVTTEQCDGHAFMIYEKITD